MTDLPIFKSSEKIVLWSLYAILNALSWTDFRFFGNCCWNARIRGNRFQ